MSQLKYNNKKYFMVKTELIATKICGNEKRSYFITENLGYTIKKICHSNTHLAINGGISKISNVCELEENKIDWKALAWFFTFTTALDNNNEIKNVETIDFGYKLEKPNSVRLYVIKKHNQMYYIDINKLQEVYGYGNAQIKEITNKFRLVNIFDDTFIRLSNALIIKILCIYQTILKTKGDKDELKKFYPGYICEWVDKYFEGSSEEIIFYIILEYNFDLQVCKNMISELVLERIDKQVLQRYTNENMMYYSEDINFTTIIDML